MKTRIISALVVLAIIIPIIVIGSEVFNIAVYIIGILGLKEFIDIKETKKEVPMFIKIISYVAFIIMLLYGSHLELLTLSIDYRLISGLFLAFLLPTVLYHDKSKYSINDAFYLIGGTFFLSLSLILLMSIRALDVNLLIYLILITTIADTFAYISGSLIGRHKLIESISPNKTWEGTIIGTLVSVFVSTVFYVVVINPSINLAIIISVSLFLSIVGSFGDLVFSAIKRYYGKKDFSNLIPGHGGILDRLDSIIFVLLGFMFFATII